MRRPATLIASLLLALPAMAATHVVNTVSDAPGDTCPATCSLRAAISQSNEGDTVRFAASLGYPATIVLQQGEITLDKALMIEGPGANRLAISGNQVGRIFHVHRPEPGTYAVAISDLSLIEGAANAFNGTRPEPDPAEGGAMRIGANAHVLMRRIEFRNNVAFGGAGAEGAFPVPDSGNGGEPGGDGGDARGGAIANAGVLELAEALFIGNRVLAGVGGNGGHGASGTNAGHGGFGGNGGDALGGAIFSIGSMSLTNISFLDNRATAQRGGFGGDGGVPDGGTPGNGGDGGAAGSAVAGAVYIAAGTADLNFVSVRDSQVVAAATGARGGFAGGLGASPGIDGTPGVATAQAMSAFGMLRIKHSLISDAVDALAACGPPGHEPLAFGMVVASDASCGATVSVHPTLDADLGALMVGGNGIRAVALAPASIHVDATFDCSSIDGEIVSADARDSARPLGPQVPVPACDLGAFEVDPGALFAHGFEP